MHTPNKSTLHPPVTHLGWVRHSPPLENEDAGVLRVEDIDVEQLHVRRDALGCYDAEVPGHEGRQVSEQCAPGCLAGRTAPKPDADHRAVHCVVEEPRRRRAAVAWRAGQKEADALGAGGHVAQDDVVAERELEGARDLRMVGGGGDPGGAVRQSRGPGERLCAGVGGSIRGKNICSSPDTSLQPCRFPHVPTPPPSHLQVL